MKKRKLNFKGKLLLAYIVCQIIFPFIMKTETPVIQEPVIQESAEPLREVRATYYYPGDSTGSGEWVGAGYHISSFDINERGWYTYKGRVVLAAATYECLRSSHGPCRDWNEPSPFITYYNYGDEITIVVENQSYEAIVLDTCGTSMNGENKIDIFVSSAEYGYDGPMFLKEVK